MEEYIVGCTRRLSRAGRLRASALKEAFLKTRVVKGWSGEQRIEFSSTGVGIFTREQNIRLVATHAAPQRNQTYEKDIRGCTIERR